MRDLYAEGWHYGTFGSAFESVDKAWETYSQIWGIRFPILCPYSFRNGYQDRRKSFNG